MPIRLSLQRGAVIAGFAVDLHRGESQNKLQEPITWCRNFGSMQPRLKYLDPRRYIFS